MEQQVYTLGRGKVFIKPEGQNYYEDFGNVTNFTISVKTEKLEHYSTASGIKVKDAEIVKSLDFSVKIEVDELKRTTLEKFMLADTTKITTNAGSVTDETLQDVKQGFWYKLSKEKIKKVPAVVVTDDATSTTTFTETTDYIIDYEAGAIYIVPGGGIAGGKNLKIDYSYEASEIYQMSAGAKYSIQGILWFKGDPPKGKVLDVIGGVSLTPSGDFNLIGDEWLKLSFEGTFTEKPKIIDRGNR